MTDRKYNDWGSYLKVLKEIHGYKITPEIETFCRYTWKEAQYIEGEKLKKCQGDHCKNTAIVYLCWDCATKIINA